MTRQKSHRFGEYGPDDGTLRDYYQKNDWSCFVQQDRDDATVRLGKTFPPTEISSVGDMSAGGARITPEIASYYGVEPVLGDLGRHYGYAHVGLLTETLPPLSVFDLYVCTETLEHLRDPDHDLGLIRAHCKYLLLTTPIMEEPHEVSHGHLWTWKREDVEVMLHDAGFQPMEFEAVSVFGIWKCR